MLISLYSIATHAGRRVAAAGLAVSALGLGVSLFAFPGPTTLDTVAGNYIIFGTAWVLGDRVRTRRAYTSELESRAAFLEREREENALRAVAGERQRIARELHDVVAHNVSVMVIQAGGARRVLDSAPERAQEALSSIERPAVRHSRRWGGCWSRGPQKTAAKRSIRNRASPTSTTSWRELAKPALRSS